MYSASAVRVQYLKVWEKAGYKVDKVRRAFHPPLPPPPHRPPTPTLPAARCFPPLTRGLLLLLAPATAPAAAACACCRPRPPAHARAPTPPNNPTPNPPTHAHTQWVRKLCKSGDYQIRI